MWRNSDGKGWRGMDMLYHETMGDINQKVTINLAIDSMVPKLFLLNLYLDTEP